MIIWYHSSSPPQRIGNHNSGCFIGDYSAIRKCAESANNLPRPWITRVIAQDFDGDFHLFQKQEHFDRYPSKDSFAAVLPAEQIAN